MNYYFTVGYLAALEEVVELIASDEFDTDEGFDYIALKKRLYKMMDDIEDDDNEMEEE